MKTVKNVGKCCRKSDSEPKVTFKLLNIKLTPNQNYFTSIKTNQKTH